MENQEINNIFKCEKCGKNLDNTYNFCSECGTFFNKNNVEILKNNKILNYNDFDPIYKNSESKLIEEFINRELNKTGFENIGNMIPEDVLKRKRILDIIFSVLVFVYISIIFFHFPIYTYIIGFIILTIFYILKKNYSLMKYLKKQLKARPNEKISNIIMNTKTSLVNDNNKALRSLSLILAIVLPLIIFFNPRIMYEKVDNEYAVRFYTFGVSNFKTATIPSTYKGKNVVSLRGNTFSNMPFLETVNLPDTIKEIRGQAFKNNRSLKNVNIPKKLEYLGGGAFYNCTSITDIELPDTLTYLGGEAFYNAKSLKSIKLSNNLSEIRGSTFEECKSLESIAIPDNITRIASHAFYDNIKLKEVVFTENSKLTEIGSSAFRKCHSLEEIILPKKAHYESNTFKESNRVQVKRIGEKEYGNLIDEDKFEHTTYGYIAIQGKYQMSRFYEDSKVYNSYIILESIDVKKDGNEFNLKYIGNNGEEEKFTLTKAISYKQINENLAVEISADYVFSRNSSVSLKIYYN